MAGIYIHIPFCASRCIYCDFFSTTSLEKRDEYVRAVCRELDTRSQYLNEEVETIYFGGGTPSQLTSEQISTILSSIYNIYNVREEAEITVEGNPDDLSLEYLTALRAIGINRLSMGVQSFDDEVLRFINRRHSTLQAENAVQNAKACGFDNISIDLMFGFPKQSLSDWQRDVDRATSLGVQHLSAYSLMYEEGTRLTKMLEQGDIQEIDEELSLAMYEYLIDALAKAGYEHYEISNFCKPGMHSRHNSSYWHGVPYLGVGAGAHSYNGESRHYNPDSLSEYLRGSELVTEQLTLSQRYDEYVFTGLRTRGGIMLSEIESVFGENYRTYCLENAQKHISDGTLFLEGDNLRLSRKGLFVSNDVMSDLMYVG